MKLNLDFLNNIKLVISGGVLIIILTLTGYVVYNQVNSDNTISGNNLQGDFFTMVKRFKDENIHFVNVSESINAAIQNMSPTNITVSPIGGGERPNPFAP